MIRIHCDAAHAVLKETEILTAGMLNYPRVHLTYIDDLAGYGKAAVVRAGTVERAVTVINDEFLIPAECLVDSGVNLIVGIRFVGSTPVIPSIWCDCGMIYDGVDPQPSSTGEATQELVDQMIAYAGSMEAMAQTLETYVIRTVAVDDSAANNYGNVDVTVSDSGAGENRKLTFIFSNLKGNGIKSLTIMPSGENKGRLQIRMDNDEVLNYDGIKEAFAMIASLDSDVTAAEAARAAAEALRAESENARVVAEGLRASAEQSRSDAESARALAETNRVVSENSRVASETQRSEAEAERISEETIRQSNEDARVANEETRTSNENTRIADEAARIQNESTRQTSEATRSTNEATRISSENTRISNENQRIQNEADRDAEFTSWGVYAHDPEAWAIGKREGVDVEETDETYHNNSKYWCNLAEQHAADAGYIDMYINENGHLMYARTSNVDTNFYIDSTNGHLIWTDGEATQGGNG